MNLLLSSRLEYLCLAHMYKSRNVFTGDKCLLLLLSEDQR
jgi:hypothetical protein